MRKSRKRKQKKKVFKRLVLFLVGAYGWNVTQFHMRLDSFEREMRSSSSQYLPPRDGYFRHPSEEMRSLGEVEDAPSSIAISRADAKILVAPYYVTPHYPPVAMFYHVYVSTESDQSKRMGTKTIPDQIQQIAESFLGTYHLHQQQPVEIHYTTVDQRFDEDFDKWLSRKSHQRFNKGFDSNLNHSFFEHLLNRAAQQNSSAETGHANVSNIHFHYLQHIDEGFEEATIQKVYEFCQTNPDHRVVYIHNKGSFHHSQDQERWRQHMTNAVTSEACIQRQHGAQTCDVCGLLWTPRPGIHLPGNMWAADCSYIQKLIPPMLFEEQMNNVTAHARQLVEEGVLQWDLINASEPWNLGVQRYAMEQWIGSHPSLRACDVSTEPNIQFWKTHRLHTIKSMTKMTKAAMTFPRHPVNAMWSYVVLDDVESILGNATAREREYFLLPGQLLKWLMLYGEVPDPSSWVWSWYPDGLKWLELVTKHGMEALHINFRNNQRIADTISADAVVCEMAKHNFTTASGLHSIVTGLEHSGTTMMVELIMSAPNLFGGLECGVLLPSNPSDFASIHPFYEWMGRPNHFGLTKELCDELLPSSGCHAEMYQRLMQHSTFFQKSPHKQLQSSWLVDKTPRYVRYLDVIMDRAPGVPVVVIQKDEADQIRSFMKYSTHLKNLAKRKKFAMHNIEEATAGINRATAKYGSSGRLLIVNATELYESPNSVMKTVFEFLGLQWRPEYLSMKALNEKRLLAGYDKLLTAFDPKALHNVNKTKKEDCLSPGCISPNTTSNIIRRP